MGRPPASHLRMRPGNPEAPQPQSQSTLPGVDLRSAPGRVRQLEGPQRGVWSPRCAGSSSVRGARSLACPPACPAAGQEDRAIARQNRRIMIRGRSWPHAVMGVMWFELRAVVVTILASAVILGGLSGRDADGPRGPAEGRHHRRAGRLADRQVPGRWRQGREGGSCRRRDGGDDLLAERNMAAGPGCPAGRIAGRLPGPREWLAEPVPEVALAEDAERPGAEPGGRG